MVHTYTLVLLIITFIVSTYLSDKFLKSKKTKLTLKKVLIECICVELGLLLCVCFCPILFPIIIYGSIAIGSFVCSFSRFKFNSILFK